MCNSEYSQRYLNVFFFCVYKCVNIWANRNLTKRKTTGNIRRAFYMLEDLFGIKLKKELSFWRRLATEYKRSAVFYWGNPTRNQ